MSELPTDVRAKILIAEDDAIVALDLQGMVMRLGYDVVAIVDSGQAAVAAAKRFHPDIILLDMVLGGSMDGIEVAHEIHKTFDMPVIFCVSSPDLSSLVRAKEISYAGYLLKPINPDSLSTTLDTVLYKYKLEKRVQKAEEKFRNLSEKCELLQFFSDNACVFEWTWQPKEGFRFAVSQDRPTVPDSVAGLASRLGALVSDWFAPAPDETQLAALIDSDAEACGKKVHAVIGLRNADTGIVSGMLIPLDDKTAGCLPR